MDRFPATFGDWSVTLLECGRFALDGGAMFGSVPRVLWERLLAPDAAHRIPLAMRLLYLSHASSGARMIIDTGIGDAYDARFRDMFAIANPPAGVEESPLRGALAAAGADPDGITHVVLTHLHFDHAGGVTLRRGGELAPAFPQAIHFLQRRNLELARDPNPRERASYRAETWRPLLDARLELLDGPQELLPGISVELSDGHTEAMQVVRVEGGGRVLFYVADLAPTRHHAHLPYTMGYDMCPRKIMEEKKALWDRALDEEALIVLEHDPEVAAGTLRREKGKYQLRGGLPASG